MSSQPYLVTFDSKDSLDIDGFVERLQTRWKGFRVTSSLFLVMSDASARQICDDLKEGRSEAVSVYVFPAMAFAAHGPSIVRDALSTALFTY